MDSPPVRRRAVCARGATSSDDDRPQIDFGSTPDVPRIGPNGPQVDAGLNPKRSHIDPGLYPKRPIWPQLYPKWLS